MTKEDRRIADLAADLMSVAGELRNAVRNRCESDRKPVKATEREESDQLTITRELQAQLDDANRRAELAEKAANEAFLARDRAIDSRDSAVRELKVFRNSAESKVTNVERRLADAERRLAEADMREWTPCRAKMPPKGMKVNATTKSGHVVTAVLSDGGWKIADTKKHINGVKAWMPAPAAYREEK